ncbi:MAG TPA: hypothetical protein VFW20_06025 [Candidatus Limnocylindrales bacterium]|nr:hypothetical protein [Candidatus Limnocylindrales bacterium]
MNVRGMPWGVALFLVYALVILAGIGITLQRVIDLATDMSVSFPGVVDMVLLAYTIFTITLVLQRKIASRGLAIGLSTLTLPLIAFGALGGVPVLAIFAGALAALLFLGLRSPRTVAWLNEP